MSTRVVCQDIVAAGAHTRVLLRVRSSDPHASLLVFLSIAAYPDKMGNSQAHYSDHHVYAPAKDKLLQLLAKRWSAAREKPALGYLCNQKHNRRQDAALRTFGVNLPDRFAALALLRNPLKKIGALNPKNHKERRAASHHHAICV